MSKKLILMGENHYDKKGIGKSWERRKIARKHLVSENAD